MIRFVFRMMLRWHYKFDDLVKYHCRCDSGRNDLKSKLPGVKKIDDCQSSKIDCFWVPYLKSLPAKHSFDKRWFDVFNRTNVFGFMLEHYIPDGFYYAIADDAFTIERECLVLDDKNMYDCYFHDVRQPKTIVRKVGGVYMNYDYSIISEQEAVEKCKMNGGVIIKPSVNASQGDGIHFWKVDDGVDALEKILRGGNLVVQQIVKQHSILAGFTNTCVNTMRLVTLLWKDSVIVTTAVLIIGGANSKTNHLHGNGMVCGILPDGRLRSVAIDGNLNMYEVHPNGQRFADVVIPKYQDCVELVKKLAPRFSRVSKLISWDLTIDDNEQPVLIEMNLTMSGSVQIAGGPVFGDMTKEVLDYIVGRNEKNN